MVGGDEKVEQSCIRQMHCHRELQGVQATQALPNSVNRDTSSSVLEVAFLKFRRHEQSPLCQIQAKLSTTDLNASLAELSHASLGGEHRLHFYERKRGYEDPVVSFCIQQAFQVIGAEFPVIKFGQGTGIEKNVRHLSFFTQCDDGI